MGGRKQNEELAIENVKMHLNNIKYGTITLVIQDSLVVQIEKNEKIRLK